ncbi:3-dehydroquinate synthase [Candidatus Kryptobacter tengchongensis]|uniref:3-dehydroquinate synthase n=1 Tax=Kryptobacter tengchongensis TaxID=1643429 RepID=UPI00070729F4|nr:3-dehydroquinate synthase [Candidatus Kryptobacter tengchongensis]CUS81103.1 3-dehydroquinate synthase [Candidatus Kryptobacter tengchongensis]
MRKITLKLKNIKYPIYIGNQIIDRFPDLCRKHGVKPHLAVITDKIVAGIYLDEFVSILKKRGFAPEIIIVNPGEESKSLNVLSKVFTDLIQMKLRRDETIVAFGGGVVGDLAGFASAVYLRGVNLIQLPTTLLAMVDSSIGGKVGINHKLGKNLIGSFYHPIFVFSDVNFLKTLPKREFMCGLGEVVKYGIIMDAEIFKIIESNFDNILNLDFKLTQALVFRSISVKSSVIQRDEKEKKFRMILNFGHTIGHGIEAGLNYRRLKHGEAVMFGMIGESFIAFSRGILREKDFSRMRNLLFKMGLVFPKKFLAKDVILKHIGYDKKIFSEQRLNMYLPMKIGKMRFFNDVSFGEIERALDFLFNQN